MRSVGIAIAACCLLTACDEDTPSCETVRVEDELVLDAGETGELTYETVESLPREHKMLQVRCPTAAEGALSISHDGFGCSTDPSRDSSRATGWRIEAAMQYVLSVSANIAGDYVLVAELRDDTEQGRLGDPICTRVTKVRILGSPDTTDAGM